MNSQRQQQSAPAESTVHRKQYTDEYLRLRCRAHVHVKVYLRRDLSVRQKERYPSFMEREEKFLQSILERFLKRTGGLFTRPG